MKNKSIDYPHPVLDEATKDYIGCRFLVEIISHKDIGENLEFEIGCILESVGISQMIKEGVAKIYLRVVCPRTSYRMVKELCIDTNTFVALPKKKVVEIICLEAFVVAEQDYDNYKLDEFNKDYFEGANFRLKKGAIIAKAPGLRIKLSTILERNVSGIVQITGSPSISEMKINYASLDEEDPTLSNYIMIFLPENEYKNYSKLRAKKHLKNGVERFLQASIIFPAVTEAISLLRKEELYELNEDDPRYKGTVWADSIMHALKQRGIDELSTCNRSDCELANLLLGNVVNDAISNLMQKLTEWSTIIQEDESL